MIPVNVDENRVPTLLTYIEESRYLNKRLTQSMSIQVRQKHCSTRLILLSDD